VYESGEFKDTVVIEYTDSKDTLIIDTSKVVKKNAKNLWTPKCNAYPKWKTNWIV
jgi:hypothetical protein